MKLQGRVAACLSLALAALACAATVRHYRKSAASALMQEYVFVPVRPELVSSSQSMRRNGYLGRGEVDNIQPYGGTALQRLFGSFNGPHGGSLALVPLTGMPFQMDPNSMSQMSKTRTPRRVPPPDEDDIRMNHSELPMSRMPKTRTPRRVPPPDEIRNGGAEFYAYKASAQHDQSMMDAMTSRRMSKTRTPRRVPPPDEIRNLHSQTTH